MCEFLLGCQMIIFVYDFPTSGSLGINFAGNEESLTTHTHTHTHTSGGNLVARGYHRQMRPILGNCHQTDDVDPSFS